jgi:hypothetical protein
VASILNHEFKTNVTVEKSLSEEISQLGEVGVCKKFCALV